MRLSEERYRALVEATSQIVWTMDADGQSNSHRHWLSQLTGKPLNALKERGYLEFIHPADRAALLAAGRAVMQQTAPYQVEFRLTPAGNGYHYYHLRGVPIFNSDGTLREWIGTVKDITESKLAENRLRLLAEISELTRKTTNASELLSAVAQILGEHLEVRRCLFNEIDLAQGLEIVHQDYCDGVLSVAGQSQVSAYNSVTCRDMQKGVTVINDDAQTDPRTAADYERTYARNGERAYVAVPLLREGQWVASLWVSVDRPRHWSREEVRLLETVAERTWTAVEKLRIDAALRESQERFSKAFNASPLVLTISSLTTGKLVEVNDTFVKVTGYSRAETLGRTTLDLGLWKRPPERETELHTVRQQGQLSNAEYTFRMRDGREIIGLLAAEKIEIGGTPFALTVIQDITERKRSEQALRESEERLRLATDAADMFAWETDVRAGTVKWSDNAAKVIGCAPDALSNCSGQSHFFIASEDSQRLTREFAQVLAADQTHYITEFRGPEPENECKYWQAQSLIIYDATRQPVRVVGVTQNITARKRAEQERERLLAREQELRLQAEEANRLKDEFLATVSHELRTPLNAILGWATMSRKQNFDPKIMTRALEVIERSARNQSQIISDILDVSRIITGKLHLNLQDVRLSSVVGAAIDTVRPSLDAKQIHLITSFAPDHGLTLAGDINRLQQVVWNLLANAVKFTPENGSIQVSLNYAGHFAEIVVTDSGIGIEPDFLPFVFDRFRQADGKKNRKHGGLGLGLAVVRHLVELHGGSARVESAGLGQGATFIVRLPLKPPPTTSRATGPLRKIELERILAMPNQPTGALTGLKLLVVDDEPDALELAAFILTGQGATVVTAVSVDEALAVFARESLNAIVSDIGMPEKDGYELMRRLQERFAQTKQPIPVIALTAYAGETDMRQILAAGYQACLPKPVEPADLVATIVAHARN